MKKTIWIFILFLTGTLIISCNKSDMQYEKNKNSGMISTCGYVEDGCQDGYFTGITIEEIEVLQCIDCANKYPQL